MVKAQFGTAQWYRTLRDETELLLGKSGKRAVNYTFVEIWTGAPAQMRAAPEFEAGFIMHLRDGKVDVSRDVKLDQNGDFVVTLPWTHAQLGVSLDTGPQWRAYLEEGNATGKIKISGDMANFPLDVPEFHHLTWVITEH